MSVQINAKMVGELRESTGAGLMDCKKALVECEGDFEKAGEWLRKKGIASAAKKAGRDASEGLIDTYIHLGGKVGVLCEINCESDFVAKTDDFKQFVRDIAISKLKKAEQSAKDDADIQNLLGFSYRKSGNLDEAAKHYDKALGLNPKHKGALEYQGELFLMLGDKAAAEDNLEKLDKICWLGCEELAELRTAIEKFSP